MTTTTAAAVEAAQTSTTHAETYRDAAAEALREAARAAELAAAAWSNAAVHAADEAALANTYRDRAAWLRTVAHKHRVAANEVTRWSVA